MATGGDELAPFKLEHVEGLEAGEKKGHGAYGTVYKVTVNGVPCIAKRIHDILVNEDIVSLRGKADFQQKFRQECLILSKLRHPNIVHFIGVHYGRNQGDLSLVMECLHTDLGRCVETHPNIPLSIKLAILLDVSYGLLYLHTILPPNGPIIHRDLSAGNILLTADMRAKIADLGVSKLLDQRAQAALTHTMGPGTPDYMPPEAMKEKPVYGAKLDVFSIGHLTLYTVNQKMPKTYEITITAAVIEQGIHQILRRRREIDLLGEDHCLYPLVTQCLQDNPERRPSTQDLCTTLNHLCAKYPKTAEDLLRARGTQFMAEKKSKVEEKYETCQAELQQCRADLEYHKRQLREHQEQLNDMEKLFQAQQTYHLEIQNDLKAQQIPHSETQKDLEYHKRQLREHQEQLDDMEKLFQAQQISHSETQNDLKAQQISHSETQKELKEARQTLEGALKNSSDLHDEVLAKTQQVKQYKKQADQYKTQLEELKAKLTALEQHYQQEAQRLTAQSQSQQAVGQREVEGLLQERDALYAQIHDLTTRMGGGGQVLGVQSAQYEALRRKYDELVDKYDRLFRQNEQLQKLLRQRNIPHIAPPSRQDQRISAETASDVLRAPIEQPQVVARSPEDPQQRQLGGGRTYPVRGPQQMGIPHSPHAPQQPYQPTPQYQQPVPPQYPHHPSPIYKDGSQAAFQQQMQGDMSQTPQLFPSQHQQQEEAYWRQQQQQPIRMKAYSVDDPRYLQHPGTYATSGYYRLGQAQTQAPTHPPNVQAADVEANVEEASYPPVTQEHIPLDPNLVCPHCSKQFRIGQIQEFKRHVQACQGKEPKHPKSSSSADSQDDQDKHQTVARVHAIIKTNPLAKSQN